MIQIFQFQCTVAPWCGHCQKMAPTLDAIAPYLEGKMAIGKIDCTASSSKKLCKGRFDIHGYPTMKIYRDGDFFDYPGNRDADSIITFAEKMSVHPVRHVVNSLKDAISKILSSKNGPDVQGVAFFAFDPNCQSSESTDDMLTSTRSLQVFGQVARKMQAFASFGLIHPMTSEEELFKFGISDRTSPVLLKVEQDVGSFKYEGEIASADFLDFVEENNVALVTALDGSNFHAMGHRGRKLAIAALLPNDLDHEGKSSLFLDEFKTFALNSDESTTHEYYFATIDGKKWTNFLNQFSIDEKNIPQIFILDVPNKIFWHNSTISNIPDFFSLVASGAIEGREQVIGSKANNIFEKVQNWFVNNSPYSIMIVVMASVLLVLIFVLLFEDDEFPVGENTTPRKKED